MRFGLCTPVVVRNFVIIATLRLRNMISNQNCDVRLVSNRKSGGLLKQTL
jgi:hypothetical protein